MGSVRQYTYKFAAKLVRMIPKLRAEKVPLPVEASICENLACPKNWCGFS